VNTLERVRSAPAGMSDAVFLREGRFVLRGYLNSWLYGSMNAAPRGFALPLKGESITRAWNHKCVFVGGSISSRASGGSRCRSPANRGG
jgi:hypothetical protein